MCSGEERITEKAKREIVVSRPLWGGRDGGGGADGRAVGVEEYLCEEGLPAVGEVEGFLVGGEFEAVDADGLAFRRGE